MQLIKKILIIGLSILISGLVLAESTFVPPSQSPPYGNTDSPVNVSSTSQIKPGGLSLGSLLVTGGSMFNGVIRMLEQAISPSPTANYGKIYWKTDKKLYKMDSDGNEHEIGGVNSINDLSDASNIPGDTTLSMGTNAGINDDGTDNRNTFVGIGAGKDTTTGISNSAFGYQTLSANTTGQDNTAIGREALSSSTTASSNTAVGAHALSANTTGSNNTAQGVYALLSNHTGSHNTAVGMNALRMNDDGSFNTALGEQTMQNNTSGSANTAIGFTTLISNTTGNDNTASGYSSLHFNTTGTSNTAMGNYALHQNTTGWLNSAFGRDALNENKTGERNSALGAGAGSKTSSNGNNDAGFNNVFVGWNSKSLNNNDQNEIVIGSEATGAGSNSVVLGNDSITKTLLNGNVGVGVTNPVEKLDVDGNIRVSSGHDICVAGGSCVGTTPYFSGDIGSATTGFRWLYAHGNYKTNLVNNNEINIQEPGLYYIHAQQLCKINGSTYFHILLNGNTLDYSYMAGSHIHKDFTVSRIAWLNVNDKIAFSNSGDAPESCWEGAHSEISLYKIGW